MKYSWKGHKDRNRREKFSQALVFENLDPFLRVSKQGPCLTAIEGVTRVLYNLNLPANLMALLRQILFCLAIIAAIVPTDSPSHGGDVVVYVFDIHQPSFPLPFYSVIVSISVFMALSTVFHSINSPDDSPISHSVLPVISALLVLSALCIFMKVSFSLDIILCGWLGLKHQLTN